jgi:glycosyltransferase involved in cell wall biosynthesis
MQQRSRICQKMKRVLMIAYHFPPFAASSGIQRTLAFARHLPRFGWEPLILTADARAYEYVREDGTEYVNGFPVVRRAFALDTARHLSLMGRYPAFAARPDRWISWWLGAVPKGLAMIRKFRPQALWSTYPIATAHAIGATLHRLSGLPWIADFRDPMAQEGYPADPKTWESFRRIEERALRNATHSVFVTPGAARMYLERYSDVPERRIAVIENGYDELSFEGFGVAAPKEERRHGPLTLLHSGVVYPSERDPTQLFEALRRMLDSGALRPGDLTIRLRASGHESILRNLIETAGVQEVVALAPPIPYRDALLEMLHADGLLVLQAANCNQQVPAKLYEYLRCGRPILALTDPAGDTAAVMRKAGLGDVARLDSAEDIAQALGCFLQQLRTASARLPDPGFVVRASRRHRTEELAHLLDGLQ